MTRINTLPPQQLTDQHLFAEWRELPRVWFGALQWLARGRPTELPERFRLGAGHMRFFYDRLGWLSRRHHLLTVELLDRGYQLGNTGRLAYPEPLGGDWAPDERAHSLSRQRLRAKLSVRPDFYRHRGQPVGRDFYDQQTAAA